METFATDYTKGELPYERPTPEEVDANFKRLLEAGANGELGDSQNEIWREFSKSLLIRLCDSDAYNINFDYDPISGLIYDDDSEGLVKIGFDYDANQGIFFSAQNPWMRQMGYCYAYDLIAPLAGTPLITHRFEFDYAGKEYRIQLWKGVYGWISYGAEMGIYVREKRENNLSSYYSAVPDAERIEMEMSIYKDGEYKFTRPRQNTWWITGFVVNDEAQPDDVSVEGLMVMRDEEMLSAFTAAMDHDGFTGYRVDGLSVYLTY